MTEKVGLDEKDTDARTEYTDKIKKLNINSAADWEAYLDTIALRPGTDAWDNYVQDVLDLIEYANGDATTSYWGALRAANGHAKPFNLQYIGLGNENWGAVYERNFKALYKVVKEKYPQITVISSAGTYLEGDAYDGNMAWIDREFRTRWWTSIIIPMTATCLTTTIGTTALTAPALMCLWASTPPPLPGSAP